MRLSPIEPQNWSNPASISMFNGWICLAQPFPAATEERSNAIRNRNACHRLTTELVRQFGHIAVEGLQIGKPTTASPLPRR